MPTHSLCRAQTPSAAQSRCWHATSARSSTPTGVAAAVCACGRRPARLPLAYGHQRRVPTVARTMPCKGSLAARSHSSTRKPAPPNSAQRSAPRPPQRPPHSWHRSLSATQVTALCAVGPVPVHEFARWYTSCRSPTSTRRTRGAPAAPPRHHRRSRSHSDTRRSNRSLHHHLAAACVARPGSVCALICCAVTHCAWKPCGTRCGSFTCWCSGAGAIRHVRAWA